MPILYWETVLILLSNFHGKKSIAKAGYYYCPLLITFAGFNNQYFNLNLSQNRISINSLFKKFFFLSLFVESIMFFLASFYSIMIVGFTILNYESGMRNFAWYYYNSRLIEQEVKGKVADLTYGIPKLFYN